MGGGIPVYWGDEKIAEYFNERAFINCHAYSSMDAVINKIIELDGDDTKYQAMLKEPVFKNGFYDPVCQDIRLEKWLISILDKKYVIRRNRKGAMKNYENRYHKQRDKL